MNNMMKVFICIPLLCAITMVHAKSSFSNCGFQGRTLSTKDNPCGGSLTGMQTAIEEAKSYMEKNFQPTALGKDKDVASTSSKREDTLEQKGAPMQNAGGAPGAQSTPSSAAPFGAAPSSEETPADDSGVWH